MLISQFGFTNRITSLCHIANGANLKRTLEKNVSTLRIIHLSHSRGTAFYGPFAGGPPEIIDQ